MFKGITKNAFQHKIKTLGSFDKNIKDEFLITIYTDYSQSENTKFNSIQYI